MLALSDHIKRLTLYFKLFFLISINVYDDDTNRKFEISIKS